MDITKKEIRISVGDQDKDQNPDSIIIEFYADGEWSGTFVAEDKGEDGVIDSVYSYGADVDGDNDTDAADEAVLKELAQAFLGLGHRFGQFQGKSAQRLTGYSWGRLSRPGVWPKR